MLKDHMIVVGEKESFIVRVLIGKAQDAGVNCEFVPFTVDDINNHIEGSKLITLYMDDSLILHEDVLHYLTDIMNEKEMQMILIGEQRDIQQVTDHLPPHLIYKVFPRPVDNVDYLKTVTDYFEKREKGRLQEEHSCG